VGTALVTTGEQDVFWPPVTGWLIALAGTLFQTTAIQWIRLAWIALDAVCVLAVYALASTVSSALSDPARRRAFVVTTTLGYGLYLPAISFAQFATSEIPALCLVLLSLVLLVRDRYSPAHALTVGLALGVLSVTRPSLLPLVLVLPAAQALGRPSKAAVRLAIVSVLASAAVIGAVVWRNYRIAGAATIAQNSAYNLYIGNRDLYAEDLDLFHPVATAGQIEFRRQYFSGELTYPTQRPEELRREALDWIAAHPGQFARRALGRLARVFAPKTDVLELLGGERQARIYNPRSLSLLAIANAQWVIVLFAGLVGLVVLYRLDRRTGTLFAATVLGSLPLCLIAISKPRYAFTFEPVLLLCAVMVFLARERIGAVLPRRDRWLIAGCAAFLLWGWAAWLVFAITSRIGLASAP
jgi:hypothetical protein